MKIIKTYAINEKVEFKDLARTYLDDMDCIEKEEIRQAFEELFQNVVNNLNNEIGKEDAEGKVLVNWVIEV